MNSANAATVLDYVKGQQSRLIGLMQELVEAESPSEQPETHDEVRRVLRLALAEVGFESRETGWPHRPRHVYARPADRRSGEASQLVVGHYDTVWPVGTIEERPFRIDGNVVHGPGSFDMKGGLAQLVIALHAIRDLGLETPVRPIIFVNADEEIGSRTSTRYIRWLAQHADRYPCALS